MICVNADFFFFILLEVHKAYYLSLLSFLCFGEFLALAY